MVSNGSDASTGSATGGASAASRGAGAPSRGAGDIGDAALSRDSIPEPFGGRRPVIGLTTYLEQAKQGVWDVRAAFLPQQYFDSVTASGGIAVLLPPQPEPDAAAAAVLDGLDGLILTGGLDVDPSLYGAERHPLTDPARPDRDAWELALFRGAEERRMPVLAICRGLQLVNVARGGTLHQHLPEALGTERFRVGGGVFATNEVVVDEGSRLAELVGPGELDVHSYHHQGIDRLGEGLVVTARTDDGLVQAFESDGEGYVLGVQWHPEENRDDRRLFAGLVAEASAFRLASLARRPEAPGPRDSSLRSSSARQDSEPARDSGPRSSSSAPQDGERARDSSPRSSNERPSTSSGTASGTKRPAPSNGVLA